MSERIMSTGLVRRPSAERVTGAPDVRTDDRLHVTKEEHQ